MGRNASRVAAMHAKCSITSTAALSTSTSTMRADRVSARTSSFAPTKLCGIIPESGGWAIAPRTVSSRNGPRGEESPGSNEQDGR